MVDGAGAVGEAGEGGPAAEGGVSGGERSGAGGAPPRRASASPRRSGARGTRPDRSRCAASPSPELASRVPPRQSSGARHVDRGSYFGGNRRRIARRHISLAATGRFIGWAISRHLGRSKVEPIYARSNVLL